MRCTILPLVAAATAFVIPNEAIAQQLSLNVEPAPHETSPPWWDSIPSLDDLHSSVEESISSTVDAFDDAAKFIHSSLPDLEFDLESVESFWDRPGKGRKGHHGRTNLTIYEAIRASNYTKKFAALVDEYPDIVQTLNSTSAGNITVFVPTDKAFERIPDSHKKPPKEFVVRLLQYHVVPGLYPASRVLVSHTLPTALKEEALGGENQRLRVRVGLTGARVNFYSKVVVVNFFAANGVVHGVDSILIPPPKAPTIISYFPAKFSTFLLAAEKTGLGKELESVKATGGTLFAPSNWAFQKLGPRANAFLFNTDKGLGYLKALLKYHVVVNETLYSDAYYGKKDIVDGLEDRSAAAGHYHIDLPTLLDDKSIAVDVARWGAFITIKINGSLRVAVQDVVAKDGVIQVINSVLIPPHTHKSDYVDGEVIEVDELVERLAPFVENKVDWSAGEL